MKNSLLVKSVRLNIGFQLGEKIMRLISSLIITYAILNKIDQELYGMMSTFVVINAMLMVLVTLGIKDKFVIALVNGRASRNLVFRVLIGLFLLVLGVIVFIQIALILNSTEKVEYLCASLVSLQLISNVFIAGRYSAEAAEDFKLVSAVDLLFNVCSLPLKYYCIVFQNSLNLFLIVLALELILSNLVLMLLSRSDLFKDDKNSISLTDLVRSSFPILLSSLVIIIYYRVDQVMISMLVGYSETAIYAAGSKVTEVLYLIPMTVVAVLFPLMIKSYKESADSLARTVGPLIFYLVWICVLGCMLITVFIAPVWGFLFEGKYQESIAVVYIHTWTIPFVALGIVGSRLYVIRGFERLLFWRSLAILAINMALNIPAIILFGAVGAAATTLLCQIVAGLLFDLVNFKTRSIFNLKITSLLTGFKVHRI